jgi:hypothetical protein
MLRIRAASFRNLARDAEWFACQGTIFLRKLLSLPQNFHDAIISVMRFLDAGNVCGRQELAVRVRFEPPIASGVLQLADCALPATPNLLPAP